MLAPVQVIQISHAFIVAQQVRFPASTHPVHSLSEKQHITALLPKQTRLIG